MQYEINIPKEAEIEIEGFYLYIAEDSPENAKKWYFSIYEKIQTLRNLPLRSPIADENIFYNYEVRNLMFGNYRILYRIQENTVQILHVKHGKMERKPF